MTTGGLGNRADTLDKLSSARGPTALDLLVVGGGITGAGVALDAASRGLTVGLAERGDFAAGTSSKSSKLVHGGLRYLEQREFALTREASIERDLLRRLAPHLVEPVPFVLPVWNRLTKAKFGVGLWTYDALATFRNLHLHRRLDPAEAAAHLPILPTDKTRGAYLYYDCKTDDVRLVMEVLLAGVRAGALACNYLELTGLSGSKQGCVAELTDVMTNDSFEVGARRVVVAGGVWADGIESLARVDASPRIRPSKGIHLVFGRDSLPLSTSAALIPDVEGKRMLFVIPWRDAALVGTTDTDYEGDLDHPGVDDLDRRYVLDALNAVFETGLTENDIAGAFAGLRPLVAGGADETADLSRRHVLYDIAPGVVGITGGKLTTFRRMAKDAVDRVCSELGVGSASRTKWIRLGSSNVDALGRAVERRALKLGLGSAVSAEMIARYGDRSLDLLSTAEEMGLTDPILPGSLVIAAEAPFCARNEMVVRLSDFLTRRTRLALTDRGAGIGAGSAAATLLASEARWDGERTANEIDDYRAGVEQERGLPLPSDGSTNPAGRARTG